VSAIVDKLRSLPPGTWSPAPPADPGAVSKLEGEFQVTFPGDYRDLLLYSGGGSLEGPKVEINFEDIDGLYAQNYDERFTEHLPGAFIIGDDGTGGVIFYDPSGRQARGAYAVFAVKLGVLGYDHAVFVATTLTQAIDRVLEGSDLRKA